MSGVFSLNIQGLDELLKELEGLERKIFDKVMAKSVLAGAKVIQKAAKELAPVRSNEWEGASYPNPPGTLKKGIAIAKATRQPPTIVRYQVGFSKKAWYGRLVELGHKLVRGGTLAGGKKRRTTPGLPFTRGRKPRPTTSGQGRVVGHVPARPFLRPAFDNNVQKAIEAMKTTLREELDKLK